LVAVRLIATANFLYTALSMSYIMPSPPLWRSRSRELAMLGLLAGAAALAIAGGSAARPTIEHVPEATLAAAEPLPSSPSATELRDVAPAEAVALNASIPVSNLPLTAATRFTMGNANAVSRARALECLAMAIYYEAGQESDAGQRAVAQVILNRVRHPAYPATVCGVVFEGSTRPTGCQFTFTCDGSMFRAPMLSAWNRASRVAIAALAGSVYEPVGLATHYHANYVLPYWASSLVKAHVEGPHIFYRWAGGWGRPAAFQQRYAEREPDARALRIAALSVPHTLPAVIAPEGDAVTAQAAAAGALGEIVGIKVTETGERVAIRFNPEAREAVERAIAAPNVARVAVSDDLRRALDGTGPTGTEAQPLGSTDDAMVEAASN
jgi:spore germination cell wall hydrolase CwlJ-like protein